MCGILGYTGARQAAPLLLDGLATLEYRGYDSAGIAVIGAGGSPEVRKSQGKLANLRATLNGQVPQGVCGIGHTRWATHGRPSDDNAHPHTDCRNEVAVVHNGIVENYLEIKRELQAKGHEFLSQTDTECIPHLIETYLMEEYPFEEAVMKTAGRLRGAQAVVAVSRRDPGKIVAFRLGNAGGIVLGYGKGEMFLSSDLPALLPHTRRIAYLAGGETVVLTPGGAAYRRVDGSAITKSPTHVPYDAVSAAKGSYKHFMQKEIAEQPEAVINTMRNRVSFDKATVEMEESLLAKIDVDRIDRVVIVGVGTSLHAGMVARHWMEQFAGLPTEVDNSSEFRYRDPILNDRTLVVSISQSGETADTLAAMEGAAHKGAKQITLTNYDGTQTTRIADGTILIRAGMEIGVAATKTFLCSLTALHMLAIYLGIKRGTLNGERVAGLIKELAHLPEMLGNQVLPNPVYERLADKYSRYKDVLYLGRGINFPMAMEGALKLKEISYIHAEGYPAGEMKHGPISLIDENMPVVALIPHDNLYEKMLSNIQEVRARGGKVIAICTEGDVELPKIADDVIFTPKSSPLISPMLMAVPIQLLAYHIAVRRGCDVDQPRNLAKSVTVE
ncbi:MAG: glutamine--fructose-6-phosphate transaminase (isomerizing) [SAR202 cluster bacterium]|nr:glutamine--fructose-6-phosphate transaminase (isomerizing) [SAR202 cluster bacterium]